MSSISLSGAKPLSDEAVREHIYHLETRGYSVCPHVLEDDVCEQLKIGLVRALENYTPRGTERSVLDRYLIHDLIFQDLMYGKLLEDPRIQQLLAPFLGDYWVMYAFTSSSIPPMGSNYGSRLHNDCPRFVRGYTFNMGVIWALDDFTRENGGTKLLPGSHHSEKAPDAKLFEENCVQLACRKGTVVVFNAGVYHRAGENNTKQWRHSLTMNACRSYMKQRMDWVRFIPPAISGALNGQAKRIIGFDTRLPTSLDEFFVPDDQRLYKPNQG
jgi:ectoine hydroxylase-related dioxygenase (phytanoyl-CoA dioxygenase family)